MLLLYCYFIITLLLYGTNYFILSEVCTRLRLKSVALMLFHCECKIVVLLKNMSKFYVKSSRKKKKSEIHESTQYHWNKKCYTFTDTDCDYGCALHCYISTFLQFQTWGWWPPPSVDSKANGTWPFLRGQVPRHPNATSLAILLTDPVQHELLTMNHRYCCFIHAGNHNTTTNSNFYIMECLGLMAAIPRRKQGQRQPQVCGCHGTVHLPGAHRL